MLTEDCQDSQYPPAPNLSPGHPFFMLITSVQPAGPSPRPWPGMTSSYFSSLYDIPLPVEAIINLFEIIRKSPAWVWPGARSVWGVRNVIDVIEILYSHLLLDSHIQWLADVLQQDCIIRNIFQYWLIWLCVLSLVLYLITSKELVVGLLVSIIWDLISSPGGNWTVRTHLSIHHQY